MVASRNQLHVMSRAYGRGLNGSMLPYAPMGEAMSSSVSYIGQSNGSPVILNMDGKTALGAAFLVYLGTGFPGAKRVAKALGDIIENKTEAVQTFATVAGLGIFSYAVLTMPNTGDQ